MKFLITGGTGFIGKYYVKRLLAKPGNEVTVLTRSARQFQGGNLRYLQWDGTSIPEAVGNVDVVINLAGAGIADRKWTDSYKKVIIDSRVNAS